MKTILVLFTIILLALPVGSVGAANPPAGRVVLTADQVHTAVDIEAAIQQATAHGTRPGTVILDGREGPFSYRQAEGNDYSINIFVSNLTLKGRNNAQIYGEEIYFDDLGIENITVENLVLHCANDCINSWGDVTHVTIRQNKLYAPEGMGIGVALTEDWLIESNTINVSETAVQVIESSAVDVLGNELSGYIPVMLVRSDDCRVVANTVHGIWQGILLTSPSLSNKVNANSVFGVQASGIALEPGTQGNSVHGNRVMCAVWAEDCLTVDAYEAAATENNISGNKP